MHVYWVVPDMHTLILLPRLWSLSSRERENDRSIFRYTLNQRVVVRNARFGFEAGSLARESARKLLLTLSHLP